MKKIILLFFVLISTLINAQKNTNAEIRFIESSVKSLKFSVDSPEEFKSINWNDIKEIFSENKNSESISLAFELKKNKKNKFHYSFKIKGKSNDIDGIINTSKRTIKVLNKINSKS